MRVYYIVFVLLSLSSLLHAANDGFPIMYGFEPHDYEGGSRIYSVVSNKSGLLYAGDKNGVLEFDGETWRKIHCGYPVTSLVVASDSSVYIAGSGGIGVLEADSVNFIRFKSLNHYISSENSSKNFRMSKVYNINGKIVFVLDNRIIIDAEERLKSIELPYNFCYSQIIDGELYLYSLNEGLFRLNDEKLEPVIRNEKILNRDIRGFFSFRGVIFLVDNNQGVIRPVNGEMQVVDNSISKFVSDNYVYGTSQLNDSLYLLKTYYKGLILFNSRGKINRNFKYSNGLVNNTVFSTCVDNYNNLWIGTAAGISTCRMNLPFTVYDTPKGIGTGYFSMVFKDNIYLATSLGLYRKDRDDKGNVSFYKIFEGHVWGLKVIGNKLYFGHPSGLYSWDNRTIERVARIQGGWKLEKIKDREEYITNSTYGLYVLKKDGSGNLKPKGLVEGFRSKVNNFEFDSFNNIWIEGDNSICRLTVSLDSNKVEDVSYYDRVSQNNKLRRLVRVNNKLRFIADSGVYLYNSVSGKFNRDSLFKDLYTSNLFPTNIIQDDYKRLWVFVNGKLSVYKIDKNRIQEIYTGTFGFVENLFPAGYENVFCINDNLSLIGIEEGFLCFNSDNSMLKIYSSAIIRNIQLKSDAGVIKNIWGDENKIEKAQYINISRKIEYDYNSIKFYYSAGSGNYMGVRYQTFLIGYDKEWSDWSNENMREYTNLPAGKYRFVIRSLNKVNEFSNISFCDFVVSPPWYLTAFAIYWYVILFLTFLFVFYRLIKIRIKKAHLKEVERQEELLYRKEQERIQENLRKEKEIIKLRNEKLRSDNLYKSRELANTTMSIIKKNQFLTDMKVELEKIRSLSEQNKVVTSDIKTLVRRINRDIDNKENWAVFEEYFDSVHENFFARLKKKFPDLSSKDLRLCAYIKMNLSTKEIAPLINITVRGVEISRYRLRKKLNIDRNESLNDFLIKM